MPFLEGEVGLGLYVLERVLYLAHSLPKTHPHTLSVEYIFLKFVCMCVHLWIFSRTNVSNCLPRYATRRHATCNMRQLAPLQRRWKEHPAGAMEIGKERCNLSGAKHGTRNRMTDDTRSVFFQTYSRQTLHSPPVRAILHARVPCFSLFSTTARGSRHKRTGIREPRPEGPCFESFCNPPYLVLTRYLGS